MEKIARSNPLIKLLRYWLPVIIWAGIIFLFSANPTTRASQINWQDFVIKKSAHVFIYGVLSTLFYRALRGYDLKDQKAYFYSIFFTVLYGFSDEFHQSFTPGREPTFRDVIFDTTGAVLAVYLISKYLPSTSGTINSLAKRLELIG